MNKNYTLKELANIGLSAACQFEPNSKFPLSFQNYREAFVKANREAFVKAILDAIGYELPKNAEREAFDAWCKANHKLATTDQFEAWKAGREELRQAINKPSYSTPEQIEESIQNLTTKEPAWILDKQPVVPAWIPWYGGDKSPIVEKQTRYEVEFRDGTRGIYTQKHILCWAHDSTSGDIMAYRILE